MLFIAVGSAGQTNLDIFLRRVYELYADYVLKNPFFAIDMPIRFDVSIPRLHC